MDKVSWYAAQLIDELRSRIEELQATLQEQDRTIDVLDGQLTTAREALEKIRKKTPPTMEAYGQIISNPINDIATQALEKRGESDD